MLQFCEAAKPTPKDNEVLVRVHAASVNAYDWHFLTADIFLIRFMGGIRCMRLPRLSATLGQGMPGGRSSSPWNRTAKHEKQVNRKTAIQVFCGAGLTTAVAEQITDEL